jgi:hypothetical protein
MNLVLDYWCSKRPHTFHFKVIKINLNEDLNLVTELFLLLLLLLENDKRIF